MKWFCKYWWLKHKYDDLLKKYEEIYRLVDDDFWGRIING